MTQATATRPRTIRIGHETDRPRIYALRHDVYARELGQHAPRDSGALSDAHTFRTAVRSAPENERIVAALASAL